MAEGSSLSPKSWHRPTAASVRVDRLSVSEPLRLAPRFANEGRLGRQGVHSWSRIRAVASIATSRQRPRWRPAVP